jgi:uncharacterized protein YggE
MAKDNLLNQLKGLSYKIGAKEREEERALQQASKDKEIRATYILREATVARVREVAKETNQTIKSVVQTALNNHLKKYDNEK